MPPAGTGSERTATSSSGELRSQSVAYACGHTEVLLVSASYLGYQQWPALIDVWGCASHGFCASCLGARRGIWIMTCLD